MSGGESKLGASASADLVASQSSVSTEGFDPSRWQPIETAPRDGTHMLAFNPAIGVYHTAFTTRWTGEPFEEGYEGFPCGFLHDGPRSYPFGKWDVQPTHWMSLPEPPVSK